MKSILNLYAQQTPQGNLLKWVGNTKNDSQYVILRSTNEIDYDAIKTVNLQSQTAEEFQFLDTETPTVSTFYQIQYLEEGELLDQSEVVSIKHAKSFNWKNFALRIGFLVILVALAAMLGRKLSTAKPDAIKMEAKPNIPAAKVDKVSYTNHNAKIEALGKVISTQPIDIVSEVAGKIEKGDVVLRKANRFANGAILFRIDNQEAILNLKSQRSNFLNLLATMLPDLKLDFADDFDKWNTYFNSINIDRSLPTLPNISDQREKTFLATRNILGQYYAIKSQEERLTKYTVTAPYGGMISEVYTDAGSVANPGTRVVRIMRTDQLELEVPIRKEDIQWVRTGTTAKIYNEDRSKSTNGRVVRISNTIDPTTQSVLVYVSVNPRNIKLYEGMYLYAEFAGRAIPKAMEINRKAISENNHVFVVSSDSTIQLKPITIHKVNTETVLFSGVEEGEMVVNDNLFGLSESMKILPLN